MNVKNALVNGSVDKVVRLRMAMALVQDPSGTVTHYDNPAAYGWHPGKDTPDRPDGEIDPATGKYLLRWPMVAEYANTSIPAIVWYWDGSFRAANGYKWGRPARWAYLRREDEVWNPATKQFDVPGLSGIPATQPVPTTTDKGGVHIDDIAGQQLVDILKRSFTVDKINKLMEASPYNEPDTGAPEDGPGAPPL